MHSSIHQSVAITEFFWIAEFVLSAFLLAILRVRSMGRFFWLKAFLWLKCVSFPVLFTLVKFKPFGATVQQQYAIYFYCWWPVYACEAIISFMIIRELFLVSLEPLEGLRKLGLVLFAWIASIAGIVSLAVSIGPSHSGMQFILLVVGQFLRCQSILQLCLLIFLLMVARPLGVTSKHRVFGTSVGFSLLAVSEIIYAGWFNASIGMLTSVNIFRTAALTMALCIWITYAFLPEPKRVPVALPVTSALLRWNEVAKSLGKSGGSVVVVGNQELIDHDMAGWDQAMHVVHKKHAV